MFFKTIVDYFCTSKHMNQYRKLEKDLYLMRKLNDMVHTPEEEVLLGEMDDVWKKLTKEEIKQLNPEGLKD